MRIPASLLLATLVTACTPDRVSNEAPLGTHRLAALADLVVHAEQATGEPAAVAVGSRPLLASNGTTMAAILHYGVDVFAARLDASGTALDPRGLPITSVLSSQAANSTRIASDGTDYLAVWEQGDIFGVRVSGDGSVLDATPIAIFVDESLTSVQTGPGVGSNGGGYLVAWESYDQAATTARDIFAARVAADGTVLDPGGFPVAIAPQNQLTPVVAPLGAGYLIAWRDTETSDIRAARVDADGTVADPGGFSLAAGGTSPRDPQIASNGTTALVAWIDQEIYYRRVDASGALGSPRVVPESSTPGNGSIALASDGDGFVCIWEGSSSEPDASGVLIASDGSIVGQNPSFQIGTPRPSSHPSVAFDGTQYVVAYEEGATTTKAVRVDTAGTVMDVEGFPIISRPNEQFGPSVAWNGSEFFLAWMDERPPEARPVGTVLDADGAPVDGTEVDFGLVSLGPIAVASNGSGFAVSFSKIGFEDPRFGSIPELSGGIVATDGTWSPRFGGCRTGALACGYASGAASDGTGYLIATLAMESLVAPFVTAYRLDAAGSLVDPDPLALSAPASGVPVSGELSPEVAFDGTRYAVVWNEGQAAIAGQLVHPADLPTTAIWNAAEPEAKVGVASDANVLLLVWKDLRAPVGIRAARVAPDGRFYDPEGIVVAAGERFRAPAVAFGGSTFLVTWNEDDDATGRLLGARVSMDGGLDPSPFEIARGTGAGISTVVGTGSDRWLVAYERDEVDTPAPAQRLYTRAVSCDPTGDCAPVGDGLPDLPEPPTSAPDAAPEDGAVAGRDATVRESGTALDASHDDTLRVGASSSGCGCRVARRRSSGPGFWLLVSSAVSFVFRRRCLRPRSCRERASIVS